MTSYGRNCKKHEFLQCISEITKERREIWIKNLKFSPFQLCFKIASYEHSIGAEHRHGQSGHARRIYALRFHPTNSDVFMAGGWDNHIKVGVLKQIQNAEIENRI